MKFFSLFKINNIYLKWLVIVGLNSISGFYWGSQVTHIPYYLAMVSGVATWYVIYLLLDMYLLKSSREDLSRKLWISAALRIPLQFFIFPDMLSGMAALYVVEFFVIDEKFFLAFYAVTILTGLFLSIFCGALFSIIYGIEKFRNRRSENA